MVPEVDMKAFAMAQRDGAFVVDVREPGEYVSGHVPGALLMPLAGVPARMRELPKGRPVYVICASGNRSRTATSWMVEAGIDARSVAGGTTGWIGRGAPVVRGPRADAA
jgi:rhodanese-related sulfurtransferase